MIEADGMTDLVHEGVAKVVELKVAVETGFPARAWIEADIGLLNPADTAALGFRLPAPEAGARPTPSRRARHRVRRDSSNW